MAEEKKPGLLKRIFSFGFGKKQEAEPEVEDISVADAAAEEETARIEAEAKAQAEKEAAEKAEAERIASQAAAKEEEARLAAEKAELEKQEAQKKADAERKAAEKAKAAAEEKARQEDEAQRKAEAAEKLKAETERLAAEKEAKEAAEREKAEAKKQAAADAKRAADEKAAKEEAGRKAKEAEEQERLAAEQEAARQAEEQAAAEEAAKEEAERAAAEKAKQEAAQELEEQTSQDQPSRDDAPDEAERKEGWFKRMRKGLARSSSNLTENITSVFTKKKLDEDTLQDLEDILIQADLGVDTAMNITDALASQRMGKDVTDEEVRQVMADEITKTLEPVAQPLELDLEHQPHVILVVGVNGSGKTTTIGKISQKLYDAGFSTLLVAGDTFRAAAIEQLHIWGDRTQAPVMSREHGADAAGLAFDAYAEAQAQRKDVMLMDTAGRLQNRKELMDELEKIIRVLKKQDPSAPHTVLLTLDATTGQNALNQVEIFKDVAGVNGLVMTKLDGTARGGILVAISAKHKLPVYFIGVGEQVEDLEPFEADVFAKAIAGLDQE